MMILQRMNAPPWRGVMMLTTEAGRCFWEMGIMTHLPKRMHMTGSPCPIQQSCQHTSPGACLWRPPVLHQPVGLAISTACTNLVLGTLQRPWRDKAGWTNFCRLTGSTYLVLGSLLCPWQDKAGWTTWCRSTWSTCDIVLGALQRPWRDKAGCKNSCRSTWSTCEFFVSC